MTPFEKFWEAYPNRRNRKIKQEQCKKLWKRKKLDKKIDVILNALEVYKKSEDWLKKSGEYVPGPHPWLNAQSWEAILEGSGKREEVSSDTLKVMRNFIKANSVNETDAWYWFKKQPVDYQRAELLEDKKKFGVMNRWYTMLRCWKDKE